MSNHVPAAALAGAAPLHPACLVEREPLLAALEFVNRIVERRNTIPILSNVMLSPSDAGGLRLVGTDLDLQCEMDIEAAWEAPGSFTVAAAALRDVVKKAPAGSQMTLTAADGRLTVTAGRTRNTLAVLPVDDFPAIDFPPDGLTEFQMPSDQLARDLAALAPAMSKDERRYYLNGVAVQLADIGGERRLVMVATDGAQMVRITRDIPDGAQALANAVIPRKTVTELLRFLKKRAPAALGIEIGGARERLRITGPGFRITSKLVDGTFPDWERARTMALGEVGLQLVAMIDLEPRLNVPQIVAMGKAAGVELVAETGESAAVLTSRDYPEFEAVSMFLREDAAPKGWEFNGYEHARCHAERYAAALAEADGLPKLECAGVRTTDGLIVGVTFGRSEYISPPPVEVIDWTRIGADDAVQVIYPEGYHEFEEGAYSVALPKSHGSFASVDVTGADGEVQSYPVRTNRAGQIELTEAAVRALAGDMADVERVDIPKLQFLHGRVVTGYVIPKAPTVPTGKKSGKRFRPMTDREQMAAYCADPVGFMNLIRARSPEECEAAYQEEHARMIAATAPAEEAAPIEETNVVHVDFAAAAAERDQAEAEEAAAEVQVDVEQPAEEAAPAAEAPMVQPEAYAALERRLAALEAIISAQGIAAPSEISRRADPKPVLAPADDRAELETIIAALRAEVATQAATIAKLKRNRAAIGVRLGERQRGLAHERAVNVQLLGQISEYLARRPILADLPQPEPPAVQPSGLDEPDPAMVAGYSFDRPAVAAIA